MLSSFTAKLEHERVPGQDENLSPNATVNGQASNDASPTHASIIGQRIARGTGVASPDDSLDYDRNLRERQAELELLSHSAVANFCEVWFKDSHPWCPILNRPTTLASLQCLPPQPGVIPDLVLKALVSFTVSHSSLAITLGYSGRRRLFSRLRSEVLVEAIGEVSLRALQALLIISVLDYGYDNISSSCNLLSICKRICEQLEKASRPSPNTGNQSSGADGLVRAQVNTVDELTYSYWMTQISESTSTVGAQWTNLYWPAGRPSPSLDAHFNHFDSFKTLTELTVNGLSPIHQLMGLQHASDGVENDQERPARDEDAYQNLTMYLDYNSSSSYTLQRDGSITFDPNVVLTCMISNAAVIILYQPHLMPVSSVPDTPPWKTLAFERCLEACQRMIKIMSTVGDVDMEFMSPLLASHLFTAARFELVHCKACSQRRPANFDVLMHALNMCGRRWPLARRLEIVLRAAIDRMDSETPSVVPSQFWDLRHSSLDIDDVLRKWVRDFAPSLYVGSLNGPYA